MNQTDEHVVFAVTDTGPGLLPNTRNWSSEKFKQVENFLTRNHGGTGLGLALVRATRQAIWEDGSNCNRRWAKDRPSPSFFPCASLKS